MGLDGAARETPFRKRPEFEISKILIFRMNFSVQPTLLVLAAGMGSRYGGLKQMDPMGPHGETVLDYSVCDAVRAGFGRVVFVIREDFAEAFERGVMSRFRGRVDVDCVFQRMVDLPEGRVPPEGRTKPWGTAHAVLAARAAIDTPFAVINADDFYGRDAYQMAARYLAGFASDADDGLAMIGYPLINTLSEHGRVNRGVCRVDDAGLLVGVEEFTGIGRDVDGVIRGDGLDGARRALDADALVSMNFWLFGPACFGWVESAFVRFLQGCPDPLKSECYLPTVVDERIADVGARCPVLRTVGHWFGVTYPEDKPAVVAAIRALIAAGEYPEIPS
jgi:hypothetical protein